MIVSMFHVRVPAEAVAGFERSWQQRAGQVDQMPGFRGLEVLRDGQEVGRYIVLTRWDSRDAFEGWAHSPEFAAAHARSSAGGAGGAQGGGVEFFEVLEASAPAQG
ncbi:MAG TPA: antibiotic biosynthesis monooxygenase [Ktedonobacterales bacterium]